MGKRVGIVIATIIVFIAAITIAFSLTQQTAPLVESPLLPTPAQKTVTAKSTFSYSGVEGKSALTLLKEKATVTENQSGFVASINGRKADDAKREYWAFYVNGKMATVGAGDYQTKDGDKLEWKIETY